MTTAEGGRSTATQSGYRPAHRVLPEYLTTGIHQYPTAEPIDPGSTVRTLITFLTPEHYPRSLTVGQVIDLQEGGQLVGHARILRILNPELESPGG